MYEKYIKRLIDIILSGLGLILASWLYLLIAAAIYIDDPGPVIFSQKRVGKDKKYFKLYKFRSMKMSTPHDTPTHLLENPDQYITRVGKFIRKTSLDEIPQLWNIFTGSMSTIGPRPALWNQDDLIELRDRYGANDVRPGLSGWAQICGRDELELEEKARLDGEYVQKMSFPFDCRCFFGTAISALRADGVVEGGTGKLKTDTDKKKIVVLSSHTPSLFWFRLDMMKEFIKCGYEVYAVGNESEARWQNRFSEHGIAYREIFVNRNGVNPFSDLKTLKSIKRVLKDIKPDKMFTYQAKTVIYGGIAAKKLGIGEVYPLIAGIGSVFLKNNLKTKLIRSVLVKEYKIALGKCPVVFFQNRDDVKIFVDFHMVDEKKVVLIPGSGVNCEKFTPQQMPETFGFLCISRLIRDKGVYEYLEACREIKKKYPYVNCLLVGPYDTNPSALTPEEVQSYVDDGSIAFFGEQEDVRPYLNMCNVFVLPSYREGTPKSNLEAMASGKAVITTDAPGCRETVTDGENGYLVPVGNIPELVEKMASFVENPELAAQMGKKGRIIAEQRFSSEIVIGLICEAMGVLDNSLILQCT